MTYCWVGLAAHETLEISPADKKIAGLPLRAGGLDSVTPLPSLPWGVQISRSTNPAQCPITQLSEISARHNHLDFTSSDSPSLLHGIMNRSLSIRSKNKDHESKSSTGSKHRFTMASLRGMTQPELSKKLFTLIKTQNHSISAYEQAAKEADNIAHQLSEWGLETEDASISEISDKIGVLLGEIGEQEEIFAQNLEESRAVLKQIRNTESSVQPSRDKKTKTLDEISKLKYKDPTSTKLPQLEQELVRDQAESLVAEAQLTNVTRQKFKEAFDIHTAAVIERAEKQIILARSARQVLNYLDDTPIVPGQAHPDFEHGDALRAILNETDDSLKHYTLDVQEVHTNAGSLGVNAVPDGDSTTESSQTAPVQTQAQSEVAQPAEVQQSLVDEKAEVQQQQQQQPIAAAPVTQ